MCIALVTSATEQILKHHFTRAYSHQMKGISKPSMLYGIQSLKVISVSFSSKEELLVDSVCDGDNV